MSEIIKRHPTKFIILLVLFWMMSSLSNKFEYQQIYTIKQGYFAAINEESYEKMMSFIVEKDMDALEGLIKKGVIIELRKGLEVYLIKSSWGKVIIRPKGHDLKLWTVREAIN